MGLGLQDCLKKTPDKMSGGQRQRAAIARALANNPHLIFADEPTGNLDSKNARIVFDIFSRLAQQDRRAVVVVTHDLDLAARATRRVHLVDGRIVSDQPQQNVAAGAGGPLTAMVSVSSLSLGGHRARTAPGGGHDVDGSGC